MSNTKAPHSWGFLFVGWLVDLDMENNVELIFRKAKEADIPSIVKMLEDDELGSKREDYKVPLPKSYYCLLYTSDAADE